MTTPFFTTLNCHHITMHIPSSPAQSFLLADAIHEENSIPAPTLTKGKAEFLQNKEIRPLIYQHLDEKDVTGLSVEMTSHHAKILNQKYGIRILVNPDAESLPSVLARQKSWFFSHTEKYLAPEKYADVGGGVFMRLKKQYAKCKNEELKKPWLAVCEKAQPFFEGDELHKLPNFCRVIDEKRQAFCEFVNQHLDLKIHYDFFIKNVIDNYQQASEKLGANKQEHIASIKKEAARCKDESDFSFYIHSYERLESRYGEEIIIPRVKGNAHFETHALTPDGKIIDIIPFNFSPEITQDDFPSLYTSDLSRFVRERFHLSKKVVLTPMTAGVGCGALALACSKELGRNSHDQIKNFTLTVTSPDGVRFFLPSPHLLRFSQWELYIEVLRTMVAEKGDAFGMAKVTYKGQEFEVKTLDGMMRSGGKIEFLNGKVFSNEEFDKFKFRWLKVLDEYVIPKRNLMYLETGRYLPDPNSYAYKPEPKKNVMLLKRILSLQGKWNKVL